MFDDTGSDEEDVRKRKVTNSAIPLRSFKNFPESLYLGAILSVEKFIMTEATISHLKNHLAEIVRDVENGQDIQITRHGKPVAVMVSLERYSRAFSSGKGIFNAYQRWRTLHPEASGFTNEEVENMRDRELHKPSTFNWK